MLLESIVLDAKLLTNSSTRRAWGIFMSRGVGGSLGQKESAFTIPLEM